jgi:hypothetical protein
MPNAAGSDESTVRYTSTGVVPPRSTLSTTPPGAAASAHPGRGSPGRSGQPRSSGRRREWPSPAARPKPHASRAAARSPLPRSAGGCGGSGCGGSGRGRRTPARTRTVPRKRGPRPPPAADPAGRRRAVHRGHHPPPVPAAPGRAGVPGGAGRRADHRAERQAGAVRGDQPADRAPAGDTGGSPAAGGLPGVPPAPRRHYPGRPLWLLLDRASCHEAFKSQALAGRLDIGLLWLPTQRPGQVGSRLLGPHDQDGDRPPCRTSVSATLPNQKRARGRARTWS